jgi:hypothetical protein
VSDPVAAPAPREPEKLLLPAAAVERLVRLALRTQLGEEWWDGFATAHGRPSWLAAGRFRVVVNDAGLLPVGED